jgi:hypothetical protein
LSADWASGDLSEARKTKQRKNESKRNSRQESQNWENGLLVFSSPLFHYAELFLYLVTRPTTQS